MLVPPPTCQFQFRPISFEDLAVFQYLTSSKEADNLAQPHDGSVLLPSPIQLLLTVIGPANAPILPVRAPVTALIAPPEVVLDSINFPSTYKFASKSFPSALFLSVNA